MRRKGEPQIVCTSCLAQITIRSFCPQCGTPTSFATEEERTRYEVALWREHSNPGSPLTAAALAQNDEPAPQTPTAAPAPGNGVPNGVVRKRATPRSRSKPAGDVLSVSNGSSKDRLEIIYRPDAEPKRRRQRAAQRNDHPPERSRRRAQDPFASERTRSTTNAVSAALPLIGDETLRLIEQGRSGFRNASLIITWYRVAVATGGRAKWIPLEEVQDVSMIDKLTLAIVAGAENLRFTITDGTPAETLRSIMTREVAEARVPNSPRHHPDILQEWCEHASARWNARIRLPLGR